MKNFFFVAVAIGIFSGTSNSVNAQTNVNIVRLSQSGKPGSLKFIESIEINPATTNTHFIDVVENEKNATAPSVEKSVISPNNLSANIELCNAIQFKYGMLMDREVETITNFSLYHFIDEWWGTQYRYGGTDKKGIDCSAFTGQLFNAVYNFTLPRTAKEQFENTTKIAKENLQEGDLVFFNTRGGVSHVGMYLGNDCFVHSSVNGGVTINRLTEDYYSRKFIMGGRIGK